MFKIQNMQQPFGLHIHRNPRCVTIFLELFPLWEDFERHHTAVRQAKRRARSQAGWKQADRREVPSAVGSWNKSHSEFHILNWINRGIWDTSYLWGLDLSLVITCIYLWSLQAVEKPAFVEASKHRWSPYPASSSSGTRSASTDAGASSCRRAFPGRADIWDGTFEPLNRVSSTKF